MLDVQLLEAGAKAPVVGHPGEDLGYDIFALEDTILPYGEVVVVRTGIAVAAFAPRITQVRNGYVSVRAEYVEKGRPLGLLIRDRSSMASKGIITSGGVIDAGYRGEVKVLMTNTKKILRQELGHPMMDEIEYAVPYIIKAGDKIAQMIPIPVLTGDVNLVTALPESVRASDGFGSTGR